MQSPVYWILIMALHDLPKEGLKLRNETPSFIKKTAQSYKFDKSPEAKKLYARMVADGMKPYYAEYMVNFYMINEIELDHIVSTVTAKEIDFYRKLRLGILTMHQFFEMDKKKKFNKKEKDYLLKEIGQPFWKDVVTSAYGIQSGVNDDIFKKFVHHIIYVERYKLTNDVASDELKNFLNKHEIKWGDMASLDAFLAKYNAVLDAYQKRKPVKKKEKS